MCKLKKALIKGDFRALETMNFSSNDIESILTDAEEALRDDENLVEETEARTAEQYLSDYKTMLVNAQELVDLLREQKRKIKKTNRKDWEEDLDEEFPEADDSLWMEESSEDDFDYLDLAARLAEFEDECEEREKEYLNTF